MGSAASGVEGSSSRAWTNLEATSGCFYKEMRTGIQAKEFLACAHQRVGRARLVWIELPQRKKALQPQGRREGARPKGKHKIKVGAERGAVYIPAAACMRGQPPSSVQERSKTDKAQIPAAYPEAYHHPSMELP